MSLFGTFETFRRTPRMSGLGGRPEVIGRSSKPRFLNPLVDRVMRPAKKLIVHHGCRLKETVSAIDWARAAARK
jgi:hypothetical protein